MDFKSQNSPAMQKHWHREMEDTSFPFCKSKFSAGWDDQISLCLQAYSQELFEGSGRRRHVSQSHDLVKAILCRNPWLFITTHTRCFSQSHVLELPSTVVSELLEQAFHWYAVVSQAVIEGLLGHVSCNWIPALWQ